MTSTNRPYGSPDTSGLSRNLNYDFSTKRNCHPEPDQALELTSVDIDTFLATV